MSNLLLWRRCCFFVYVWRYCWCFLWRGSYPFDFAGLFLEVPNFLLFFGRTSFMCFLCLKSYLFGKIFEQNSVLITIALVWITDKRPCSLHCFKNLMNPLACVLMGTFQLNRFLFEFQMDTLIFLRLDKTFFELTQQVAIQNIFGPFIVIL